MKIMDFKPALEALEGNNTFKKWRKSNKDDYFSYAFRILQEQDNGWQLGFYGKKKDKITTFIVDDGNVEIRKDEEVFKREETAINGIELDKIRLAFEDILEKSHEFQQENFPKEKSIKTIAILQNLEELGNVWNMTYITESFNTLNIKIDASNGKVLEHKLMSIFSFRKD